MFCFFTSQYKDVCGWGTIYLIFLISESYLSDQTHLETLLGVANNVITNYSLKIFVDFSSLEQTHI